ncbi:MAG TPA: glucose 1-dehydrogenase [Gammaproteobacteria bacterium]|jgi:3alpha(or 20beta)-hydroxysteroid dehydrogenase|nr:glucose 1-dehydrogenase [Gammaproteobacteria bacterium]HIK68695.1 glucose 1-dehydrogenase [Pseudomonadales bacterium]
MTTPFTLEGKVAIVTGAARGIGRAIAEAFVQAGAKHVVCTDVLGELLAEIEVTSQISTQILDVRDEAQWNALVTSVTASQGGIDILVNNAGILVFGTIEETPPDDFKRLLDVNITGTFLGMQAVIPVMKAAGSGAIVNTSSASGMLPSNFVGAYAASKYAVRGLTRAAALELGLHGIRVNSIHPGGVNTPMTNPAGQTQEEVDKAYAFVPLQRGCTVMEVAHGVTYLASDAASYCNGTELVIDGGMTAGIYFPGLPGAPQ